MAAHPVVRFAGKLPKLGNSPDECEDAFSSTLSRFAVADGASEGCYSHIWASILVRSFCDVADGSEWQADEFSAWLDTCRLQWSDWQSALAQKELPWFTQEKLRLGSFATFLGISVHDNNWHAFAYGDSCLFIVRNDALVEAFPVRQSGLFDNTPPLVPSTHPLRIEDVQIRDGEIRLGDRLYLTSDALANWFLADSESGEKPWLALDGIGSDQEFEIFVSEARQFQAMRNDDVTLLCLEVAD